MFCINKETPHQGEACGVSERVVFSFSATDTGVLFRSAAGILAMILFDLKGVEAV
jgi:hypothetical protein